MKNCSTINEYKKSCGNVIHTFEHKHSVLFTGWVSDEVGGIAVFDEYYHFNLSDIVFDIENDIESNMILVWHEYVSNNNSSLSINFKSYLIGARYEIFNVN